MSSPSAESDDIALMHQVAGGDEVAFTTLYTQYHARVRNFFYGLSRNAPLSADLSQETFLRIWKFRQRYTSSGSFLSYLFGFARNIWLEQCRVQQKQFKSDLHNASGQALERFMAAPHPEPDTVARHAEINAHIFEALESLPNEQRMVFVLRSIEGLSLDEVAFVMQCPRNTVRSRQLLALKKMRRLLTRTYGHEEIRS